MELLKKREQSLKDENKIHLEQFEFQPIIKTFQKQQIVSEEIKALFDGKIFAPELQKM